MSMPEAANANLQNPVPVLQQDKSKITTNPFIPNQQREKELAVIQNDANKIIAEQYNKNTTSSIKHQTLAEINVNIGKSLSGIFDDLFRKPTDTTWLAHLSNIFQKDQRYTYVGILCIFIAIVFILIQSD